MQSHEKYAIKILMIYLIQKCPFFLNKEQIASAEEKTTAALLMMTFNLFRNSCLSFKGEKTYM